MTPNLNLLYVHAGWIGYGRVGIKLAAELDKLGIEVFDHLDGSEAHYSDGGGFIPPALQAVGGTANEVAPQGRKGGRSNVVCWVSVPSHGTGWYEGQIPVCFTMWEGMRLPEQFRESFHEFETIICPSMQNYELFSRYHDNVKYVPLGIDPDEWTFRERQMPTNEFRFLCGGSGKRKGNDLVVDAFKKLWPRGAEFGDKPIPKLILKSPKGEAFYGERISTVGGYLSREEEIDLYAYAHCYVQPSRGEGFGLQPLQAIAQGLPTILTADHGHAAFADLGIPISSTPVQSDYFIFGDAGDWWEPNFDELCDRMQEVYESYEPHVAYAKSSSTLARREFTWAETARKFVEAIGPERLTVPYSGSGEWHAVEALKFKVITLRNWDCSIAGQDLYFLRGKEYWQTADIKRILFEAGVLDPACLNEDDPDQGGLTDMQVQRAGKYRAQYENCPTCGKALG